MRVGTTAFSFTNEWLSRRFTLEQLLERVAELGLGPGIELIGFQAWRWYPALTAGEANGFRGVVDGLGLEPAALGAYVDLARRPDRLMTTAEAVGFLAPQIAVAHALGFPLLRLHGGIPPAAIEQLVPVAERAGVTLATEVQGGQTPEDPALAALLEVESPHVALALDFSVSMTAVPARFVDSVSRLGIAREDVAELVARWAHGAPTHELFAALAQLDAPAAALDEARAGFVRFGRQDPQAWLPLVPRIAYAHAKFWQLDESGDDPTTRTEELVDVLRVGGYDGYVASEWGGSAWADLEDVDAFELVRRHHARCRHLVASPAVPA
jgi:hypothetical protein